MSCHWVIISYQSQDLHVNFLHSEYGPLNYILAISAEEEGEEEEEKEEL